MRELSYTVELPPILACTGKNVVLFAEMIRFADCCKALHIFFKGTDHFETTTNSGEYLCILLRKVRFLDDKKAPPDLLYICLNPTRPKGNHTPPIARPTSKKSHFNKTPLPDPRLTLRSGIALFCLDALKRINLASIIRSRMNHKPFLPSSTRIHLIKTLPPRGITLVHTVLSSTQLGDYIGTWSSTTKQLQSSKKIYILNTSHSEDKFGHNIGIFVKMGAKFWTAEEKQVFVDIIIPMSTEASKNTSTGEKLSWDALVPIMQAEMNKRGGTRVYSKNSLFQHWYQKVGPRAQRRGEADTMTVPSKAPQRRHNRGRNGGQSHFAGPSTRVDDDYYKSEDELSDLEPFPQYISRRGESQAISKAGRRSLFVEDTDEEDQEEQARQARAHYRDPRYDEFVWRFKGDLLDDENDIPGKAEDEAYEAQQRGNKGGNKKRNVKKQEKGPSGKRPRHSLNDTMVNDYEEPRHVSRKLPSSANKTRSGRLNDINDAVDEDSNNEFADNELKKFPSRHRQPNKAPPAGKLISPKEKSFIIVDSDEEDRPYESPYQPRASYPTSAHTPHSQAMGPRYTANTQRQSRDMRAAQTNINRHSNGGRGSYGYTEAWSGYGSDNRVSPSGYLSEQAEQRQAYLQQTSQYLYHGQQAGMERLRQHDLTDEGAGRFPTSNERHQYAPQAASSTAITTAMGLISQSQSGHPDCNPRSSNAAQHGASSRGPFLTPHQQEQGRAHAPSVRASGLPPPVGTFTPGLLRNPHRERSSSPGPDPARAAADREAKVDVSLEAVNGDGNKE